MKLAREIGIVTLPASFFGLGNHIPGTQAVEQADHNGDRWIRFSIANVNEESLRKVGERLNECGRTFEVIE
jgi:aspartate/methionine/tyrosine aminotransferase